MAGNETSESPDTPMEPFTLVSDFEPAGDQPQAIDELARAVDQGVTHQTLLGVTGSGKTYTMASVVAEVQKPTLILAPNKTLAAQLYGEFARLFPHNAVEYFVSYYDYYQPEAYVPRTDTYIEKDAAINEHIDKMRHATTRSLLERRDVIVVASVSCIYGIGSPADYAGMLVLFQNEMEVSRDDILRRLVEIQYARNDIDFHRGTFRVRGDVVDIFPAHEEERALRVEFFGDFIESMTEFDPLTGEALRPVSKIALYPSSHYVTSRDNLLRALGDIGDELEERLGELRRSEKLLEAQRLEQRTRFDLEILRETGICSGIENYSRHLDGRQEGEPPATLFDYFPDDFLLFIDESHIAVPQVGGMYHGDRSRKQNLVDYGFRLPSALDNRPLNFDEFRSRTNQVVYVSATPADYELRTSGGVVVEQIIRPTGLMDPEVLVRPATGQVDDLLDAVRERVQRQERGAGHHADQAHGRGTDRLLPRAGRQGVLPALRHSHLAAHRDHPRVAPRHLRRAGRRQSACAGAGPAGGVAGGHSRRRQGGLPAFGALADPDHRTGRAAHQRPGADVRRRAHRLAAAGHRRDQPPPRTCRTPTTRCTTLRRSASCGRLVTPWCRRTRRITSPCPSPPRRRSRTTSSRRPSRA